MAENVPVPGLFGAHRFVSAVKVFFGRRPNILGTFIEEGRSMANFGYYTKAGLGAAEHFTGDEMQLEGEYVKIWTGKGQNTELVAAVRLDKGHYVKKENA
jgi:hypothetical protein